MESKHIHVYIILFLITTKLYLCQDEQEPQTLSDGVEYTDALPFNDTLSSDDALVEDSFSTSNFMPQNITTYSSMLHEPIIYTTDEEDYTTAESLTLSIRTNQHATQTAMILMGYSLNNISYTFIIEDGGMKLIFSQDNLVDVVLTTKNNTLLINDGHWHRLDIERSNQKLRFALDNVHQSDIDLSDEWQVQTNIFVGAQLTIVPHGNYDGEIGDIAVLNMDRTLEFQKEENYNDPETTTLMLTTNLKDLTQTIAFLPNDNEEISFPLSVGSFFKTLSFAFRKYSNLSTILQFDEISLSIDMNGYLTLTLQNQPAQVILSNEEQETVQDGQIYFVQLELHNQTLEAWIDDNKKSSIPLSSSFLIVEKFLFGAGNRFLGCIENIIYNHQILLFEYMSLNRQKCFSKDVIINSKHDTSMNQIISFRNNDRPLIINFDNAEELLTFSFSFYTQESNSIVCSLSEKTYEQILIVHVQDKQLFLTYYSKQEKVMSIPTNHSINDKSEHRMIIKVINRNYLLFEVDESIAMENMNDVIYIDRIYIGRWDPFVQEALFNFSRDYFIGCIGSVMLNGRFLIEPKHIYQEERLLNSCQMVKHENKHTVLQGSSDTSFSIRNYDDIVEFQIPSGEEFHHYQISIKTQSSNGIITSIHSNVDNYAFVLFLLDGKIHLTYYLSNNVSAQLIFNDNHMINDGQQHTMLISRQILNETMYIKIDNRTTILSNLSSFSLFFDAIIIGGSYHNISHNLFKGCFANIKYNHHSLFSEGIVKSDRYDCFYDHGSICDRQTPCHNLQSLQFCGQTDCSLVCTSSSVPVHDKGSLRYLTQIQAGQYEEIHLMIFTLSTDSILFVTQNGSIQVSIVIQNYYPRLIIRNGGILYTYDFPGRVRGDQWHVLQCQRTLNTIDLTFDDETRHYTHFIDYFSLFGDGKVYFCGNNFIGYIQDIILMSDDYHENLIHNSIRNPGLIDYDSSVTWNNRVNMPERTPCERIQCLNGGYCIQPASSTALAYCHCPSQYTGYRCEQTVDPCTNYQCNHGTCQKDRSSQPYCSCYEGYGGSRCDAQIDPCAKASCNHGRCKVIRSVVVCQCYQGYTGRDCLTPIDICARVSCNYGTCISEGTSYRCQCQRGYEGPACDQPIDLCSDFVCYNGGVCHVQDSRPTCECTLGYRGSNCYELVVVDPCTRYECYGGSCMNDRGVARCICPTGRAGSHCQEDICVLYPCANNGQCVPEGGSRRCVCTAPYYGDDCREIPPPNPCENVYCGYGQCREGICECYGGYTGTHCDIAPDPCANINCNFGRCNEGHCLCMEDYIGTYCETQVTTTTTTTTQRPLLVPQTVGHVGPKTGQLIDYGRMLGTRAGPIGWILALVSGLLLLPLAIAFAARQCTKGACCPPKGPTGYIPVVTGATGATQTDAEVRTTRDIQLFDERADHVSGTSEGVETTRIEQTREIIREYSTMDTGGKTFTTFPVMSSRHGDSLKDNHQQQTSSSYSKQHIIETDYHVPPVADFGFCRNAVVDGYRDTFESWEASGGGTCSYAFADGGLQTDYELSNINSITMTPNGKYAIVGQSQGPPQIWDALNGQLVSSMQGTCNNCTKVALACNGTLIVALTSDGIDTQTSLLQIWDVNTGKPVQLTHQIKCATFTLSNNSNNLIMAGNQKYGRGISVGILDLSNSELAKEIKSDTSQSYGGTPSFITLTPDERFAIVGCPSGLGTSYVTFDLTTPHELIQPSMLTIDSDPKCTLALNNDQALTGTRNGQVIVWDILTCQRLSTLNENGQHAHRDRITDLKLSPDRSYFITASADGTAKVWDANSKELISRLIGHKREITCACVSTNQLIATGSRDQHIYLWRTQTGQIASTMPVNMTPLDIHMAAHNRTVVAIGDKDGERQLLMLRVLSLQR